MKSAIARIKGLVFHFLEIPKYTKSPKKRIRDMTKMERWLWHTSPISSYHRRGRPWATRQHDRDCLVHACGLEGGN